MRPDGASLSVVGVLMSENQLPVEPSRESEIAVRDAGNTAPSAASRLNRRRQLITALTLSPIALTLASRPAWANGCSVSAQLSGNLSHQGTIGCAGFTPGYWKNHTPWPGAYGPTTTFNSLPGCAGFLIDGNGNGQVWANQITLGQCFEPDCHSVTVKIGATTKTVKPLPSNGQNQEFLQQVVCAIISAAYYTDGAYGYTQPGILAFIKNNWMPGSGLYTDLTMLNQDNRPGHV